MRIDGELTLKTVPARLADADAWSRAGRLDLSGVSHADSAGLALLLELSRRAMAAGTPLTLHSLSPQLASLVAFFELESVLNLEAA